MADTRQQLQKAKALIEQKRYEDAKALLITVDHPTADKWLERLNKLNPPQEAVVAQPIQKPMTANRKFFSCLVYGLLLVICIPTVIMIFFVDNSPDLDHSSPQALAESIVRGEIGSREMITTAVSSEAITVRYEMGQDLGGYDVSFTNREMVEIACELDKEFSSLRFTMIAQIGVVDNFGNESVADGVTATLSRDTMRQINCDNAISADLVMIADSYDLHPALWDND